MLTLRPAEYMSAMWRVHAPAGERAELSVAARIFNRPKDKPYVGRHRKANRRGTVVFVEIDDAAFAAVMR